MSGKTNFGRVESWGAVRIAMTPNQSDLAGQTVDQIAEARSIDPLDAAFPGRGIRVWGARTLSSDSAWSYVNVRRLLLTAGRWLERNMSGITFEPNDETLWARIQRDLTVYFNDMFRRGALKGSTPQEAFYIRCDAQTNPPDAREAGTVVTEIGLAPAAPSEFVIVRIISDATGFH